MQNFA